MKEADLSFALPRYLIEMDVKNNYEDYGWRIKSKMVEFDDNKILDEVKAFRKEYPGAEYSIKNVRVSKVDFKFHVK